MICTINTLILDYVHMERLACKLYSTRKTYSWIIIMHEDRISIDHIPATTHHMTDKLLYTPAYVSTLHADLPIAWNCQDKETRTECVPMLSYIHEHTNIRPIVIS